MEFVFLHCYIANDLHHFRYPNLLPYTSPADANKLSEELLHYQLLERSDIPEHIWQMALVHDGDSQHYIMDVIWAHLQTLTNPDGSLMLEKLCKTAFLILTLPHSNAEEERIFSMVTKNKTKFRSSLQLDGTLSSILTLKCADIEPCHSYDPPVEVLETAKKATMIYNSNHRK